MSVCWLEQTEADLPIDNQWLSVRERVCLNGLHFAKRRSDWRLGRWTAKHAVAACLNLPANMRALADIEVLAGASGAPQVFLQNRPAEIAISLSHRDGRGLCTVAPAGTSFGCDLEAIECHSDAFIADYCTSEEQELIARIPLEHRDLLVCLMWSAKESALKALRVGLRLDTRSVCVRPAHWSLEAHGNAWQELCIQRLDSNPDGWRPLSVRCAGGPIYQGWWRVQDQMMRTTVCEEALEIPFRMR